MSDVRILNASLEDDKDTGDVILRGVIDQECLRYINMAWYQRERGFSSNHVNEIMGAYFIGSKVADVTLGMRGARCNSKGDIYLLHDKIYCMDGGQRIFAAAKAIKDRPDLKIHLGAKIFFNTTEEFENDMFCRLGTTQVRIAPSVLLRNRRKKSLAAAILVALNQEEKFALKSRISWDQVKTKHELMAGYTLARVVGALHAHKGGLRTSERFALLDGLDRLVANIGEDNLRTNIIRFFDTIDKCWTIRHLAGGRQEPRPHLKPAFLLTLADLFSGYPEFWDGKERNEFYFPEKHVRKLRGFRLADYMRASSTVPMDALYEILRKRLGLEPLFKDLNGVSEAAE